MLVQIQTTKTQLDMLISATTAQLYFGEMANLNPQALAAWRELLADLTGANDSLTLADPVPVLVDDETTRRLQILGHTTKT